MAIIKTSTPSNRPGKSPGTFVTRIGDGCANGCRWDDRNEDINIYGEKSSDQTTKVAGPNTQNGTTNSPLTEAPVIKTLEKKTEHRVHREKKPRNCVSDALLFIAKTLLNVRECLLYAFCVEERRHEIARQVPLLLLRKRLSMPGTFALRVLCWEKLLRNYVPSATLIMQKTPDIP